MKKIEDYLKHYIGCDVIYTPPESAPLKCKLVGFTRHEEGIIDVTLFEPDNDDGYEGFGYRHDSIDYIELLLRPLSSMTEEEQDEVWYMEETNDILTMESGTKVRKVVICTDRMHYLLSNGFDIFGLIDAKLALDATKIEKV